MFAYNILAWHYMLVYPGIMSGVFGTRFSDKGYGKRPEDALRRVLSYLPQGSVYCLNQVHSDRIVLAEKTDMYAFPKADAIISTNLDDVLCIQTADCLPVLALDTKKPVMAAIHAGWRGLAKGIVKKTLIQMQGLGASNIRVSIGPGIGPCCFDVGMDVAKAIQAPYSMQESQCHVDLWQGAFSQAIEAGIDRHMIQGTRLCTKCNKKLFFSYRRDGDPTGRMLSLIGGQSWLLPGLRAL
ncbi:MAG: peptidoglycan editing factor PgeF [Thermodesulfobacteriota bacterium]|nr:peptidoglycan editing factor PgeF [Thermodesulfobacteriota bacterium]